MKSAQQTSAIHFSLHGLGQPVVLGHSFLCCGAMWSNQVGPLAEKHQVINIDARSHGQSAKVDDDFSLYDMVDDVLDVLDRLGIDRAIWAGLSVGGMVALRAALTVPDRVEALILLDTDAGAEKWLKRCRYALLGTATRFFGIGPMLPQIVRRMFGPTTLRNQPDLVSEWKEQFRQSDVLSVLKMLAALQTRDDLVDRLPDIRAPALVVCGAEDRALPPARSRRLAEGLPNARFVEIANAGHLVTLEQPRQVTAAILEFVESL